MNDHPGGDEILLGLTGNGFYLRFLQNCVRILLDIILLQLRSLRSLAYYYRYIMAAIILHVQHPLAMIKKNIMHILIFS